MHELINRKFCITHVLPAKNTMVANLGFEKHFILSPTEEGGVLETNSKYSDVSVGLCLSTLKFEEYLGI